MRRRDSVRELGEREIGVVSRDREVAQHRKAKSEPESLALNFAAMTGIG